MNYQSRNFNGRPSSSGNTDSSSSGGLSLELTVIVAISIALIILITLAVLGIMFLRATRRPVVVVPAYGQKGTRPEFSNAVINPEYDPTQPRHTNNPLYADVSASDFGSESSMVPLSETSSVTGSYMSLDLHQAHSKLLEQRYDTADI